MFTFELLTIFQVYINKYISKDKVLVKYLDGHGSYTAFEICDCIERYIKKISDKDKINAPQSNAALYFVIDFLLIIADIRKSRKNCQDIQEHIENEEDFVTIIQKELIGNTQNEFVLQLMKKKYSEDESDEKYLRQLFRRFAQMLQYEKET